MANSIEKSPIIKVVKKILPAVVSITASKYLTVFESPFGPAFKDFAVPKGKKKVDVSGGSGFIVEPSGIILTNRHVVADPTAEYIVLLNDDKKYTAEILARDPINDVAIIKINAKNLPVIELGDSAQLDLGETVIAIGNALGTFRNTVSRGVISGLSREIMAGDALTQRVARLRGLVQTDAAINPGNSGGPLVNIDGKAIGINTAMVFFAENIGFALPINNAKKDLEDLKQYGRIRQPFLGIRYVLLNQELKNKYNLPVDEGALVVAESMPEETAVVPRSAADRAGIKQSDIILEIQKEKITIKNQLEDLLQKYKVGQTIELKFLRNNKEMLAKVTLEERK